MAVRSFSFVAYKDKVNPAQCISGGLSGEHNATELEITIDDTLYEQLLSDTAGKVLMYRFEAVGATGIGYATEPDNLESKTVKFTLPKSITENGGRCTVTLIFTIMNHLGDTLEIVKVSPISVLLGSAPELKAVTDLIADDEASLYKLTKEYCQTAKECASNSTVNVIVTENNVMKTQENVDKSAQNVAKAAEKVEEAKTFSENAQATANLCSDIYETTKVVTEEAYGYMNMASEYASECRSYASLEGGIFAPVAFSGNYNDLYDAPEPMQVADYLEPSCYLPVASDTVYQRITSIESLFEGTIYDSNLYVKPYAYYENYFIESVNIRPYCKGLSDYAFYKAYRLTDITIPDSVEYIGEYALSECNGISVIHLPNSIKSIAKTAFNSAISLSLVTLDSGFNCDLDFSTQDYLSGETLENIIEAYPENCNRTVTLSKRTYSNYFYGPIVQRAQAKGITFVSAE